MTFSVSDSVPGHIYEVLTTDSLTNPIWSSTMVETGTGSNLLISLPINSSNQFFKLDVRRQ